MLVLTSFLQTSTSRPREAKVSVPCHCSWVARPGCEHPPSGSPPTVSGIPPCCLPGAAAFTFWDISLRKVWKHLLEGERQRLLRVECHLQGGVQKGQSHCHTKSLNSANSKLALYFIPPHRISKGEENSCWWQRYRFLFCQDPFG